MFSSVVPRVARVLGRSGVRVAGVRHGARTPLAWRVLSTGRYGVPPHAPPQQPGHAHPAQGGAPGSGPPGQGPSQAKPVETLYLTPGNFQKVLGAPMPLLLVASNQDLEASRATELLYTKSMRFLEATKGQVPLVKLDAATFPEAAQNLQIHSLPAVYFISQGRVVDRVGGGGEEIKPAMLTEYFERLAKMLGVELPSQIAETLLDAAFALDDKDIEAAATLFQSVVANNESSKENLLSAGAGLTRVHLAKGEFGAAQELLASLQQNHPGTSSLDVRHAQALLKCHAALSDSDITDAAKIVCEQTVAGDHEGAIQAGLKMLRKSKTPETKELVLQIIDAAGPKTDVAKKGRKRFSSALFI